MPLDTFANIPRLLYALDDASTAAFGHKKASVGEHKYANDVSL